MQCFPQNWLTQNWTKKVDNLKMYSILKTIPIIGTFISKESELKRWGRTQVVLLPVHTECSKNAADEYWDRTSLVVFSALDLLWRECATCYQCIYYYGMQQMTWAMFLICITKWHSGKWSWFSWLEKKERDLLFPYHQKITWWLVKEKGQSTT